MNHAGERIAVFDVCDTLFSANTTLGFLRSYAHRTSDPEITARLKRWTSRFSPAFYAGAIAYRLTEWDIARSRLIHTLQGHSRADLQAAAGDYVSTELPRQTVVPVHMRLRQHRDFGDRIILASSSLDIVIAAVARNLGVEWVASELEFAGETCTGKLAKDLTGRKPAALSAMIPSGARLHVYTDNQSDAALLRMAERCTIILAAGSNGRCWAGEDCEYIAI